MAETKVHVTQVLSILQKEFPAYLETIIERAGKLGTALHKALELINDNKKFKVENTPTSNLTTGIFPNDTEITSHIPLQQRMTTTEEIANMVAFLLSSVSSHTTGQIIYVDGGYVHLDRALANA